jgi:hypothetical protein
LSVPDIRDKIHKDAPFYRVAPFQVSRSEIKPQVNPYVTICRILILVPFMPIDYTVLSAKMKVFLLIIGGRFGD